VSRGYAEEHDPDQYTEQNPLTVRPHHLKLLRNMNVRWGTVECGAPEVDNKRPYGNSDVVDDVREITEMLDAKSDWCLRVHRETEAVLQVFLRNNGDLSPGDQICYRDYRFELMDESEVSDE